MKRMKTAHTAGKCSKKNRKAQEKKLSKKNLIPKLYKTIAHHFPHLLNKIREIEDFRRKKKYELAELIMAAVVMFVFKKGSRNAFDNEREEEEFRNNYEKIFKVRFPHMDTVDNAMRALDEKCLEKLKTVLVKNLIKKKSFHKYRLMGKYHRVVVDGTHVMTVRKGHCEHCLHRTSGKTGKTTYFHNILEAKLVCENGFCISLGTEWIENPNGEYDKQDCELKAFVRLAEKLKTDYPRLPICIEADGLYPNQTFFRICKENGWEWLITFKDGNLPSLWKEVLVLKELEEENSRRHIIHKDGKNILHTYTWVRDLDCCGFAVNWFECVEEADSKTTRFVHISSLEPDYHNILEMTESGRMRWKIENEGFDIQKNHGYGLGHQYSRVSVRAAKNYHQCMQIAHMICQLFELSSLFRPLLTGKMTVRHLWIHMLGEIRHLSMSMKALNAMAERRMQFRYD
jgi:hypothetical protein